MCRVFKSPHRYHPFPSITAKDHPEEIDVIDTIIAKTIEYLAIPAVVGHEKVFMNFLYKDFKNLGLSAYKHEGLLEIHGMSPNDGIVCAHLDRHGLISLGDNEFVYAAQYMKEIKYGESNQSSRKQVEAIAKRFEGEAVYAYHPDHGTAMDHGVIQACYPHMKNNDALFYVDGLSTYLGYDTPLAYERQARVEENLLKGQIDNVVSIAAVYALFEDGYQGSAYLTCEEEIGKSWIHIANFLDATETETNKLIVIDTSPYTEPGVIDEGPVIFRNRDKSAMFNKELVEKLTQRCQALGIPFKIKDEDLLAAGRAIEDLGSTELGRLVDGTGGRWSGATVQIPTLMYHTSNETTTKAALENYYSFLHNILIEDLI